MSQRSRYHRRSGGVGGKRRIENKYDIWYKNYVMLCKKQKDRAEHKRCLHKTSSKFNS